MEIARFWGSLEMPQSGFNMTSSALLIRILVSQIILAAGESAIGLVERQSLAISGPHMLAHKHPYGGQPCSS
jgi:hypothetical protein